MMVRRILQPDRLVARVLLYYIKFSKQGYINVVPNIDHIILVLDTCFLVHLLVIIDKL